MRNFMQSSAYILITANTRDACHHILKSKYSLGDKRGVPNKGYYGQGLNNERTIKVFINCNIPETV